MHPLLGPRQERRGGGGRTCDPSQVCAQTQLSNEAAGENVEYEVDGGGMLATFCHQRKLGSITFWEPAPVPLDSGNSSRIEHGTTSIGECDFSLYKQYVDDAFPAQASAPPDDGFFLSFLSLYTPFNAFM
jgi:hypothetical protein